MYLGFPARSVGKEPACTAGDPSLIPGLRRSAGEGIGSVQFSRSVMSDSLRPHESQHARPPCPSPTPGVYPDSCPSLPAPVFLGFHCGSAGKESACNVGDFGSIPGLGRSPGEGKSYPLQYSVLENSIDCIVHGVTKNLTRPSDFHLVDENIIFKSLKILKTMYNTRILFLGVKERKKMSL